MEWSSSGEGLEENRGEDRKKARRDRYGGCFLLCTEAVPIENLKDPKVKALVDDWFVVWGRVKDPQDAPVVQQNHCQFEVSLMAVVSQTPPNNPLKC